MADDARRQRIEALKQKHLSRRSLTADTDDNNAVYENNSKAKREMVKATNDDLEEGARNIRSTSSALSPNTSLEESSTDEISSLQEITEVTGRSSSTSRRNKKRFSPGIEGGLAALVSSRVGKGNEHEEPDISKRHSSTGRNRSSHGRGRRTKTKSNDKEEKISSGITGARSLLNRHVNRKNINISPRAHPEDMTLFDQEEHEAKLDGIRAGAASISLLLQGILAGFCIQTLFDAIPKHDPSTFILQYAQHASETRRFYFLVITMCLSGSLCLVVPPRESLFGGTSSSPSGSRGKDVIGTLPEGMYKWIWAIVACYGLALILTLPIAVVDVQLFTVFRDIQEYKDLAAKVGALAIDAGDIDEQSIRVWRGLSIMRSALCLLAWCLACLQQKWAYVRRREIIGWYN